ncbi:MAG TPA: hypothetical protein VFO49_15875 [Nocardioides sp.]|nr:hypothetical protein [Nocardioides sp.]
MTNDYSVDDEDQLPPEDTLEDGGDPLDDLNTPPDDYSAGQRFGNTPAEEERGETLAQRLRQEEPESGDPYVDDSDRPAEEAAIHEVDDEA